MAKATREPVAGQPGYKPALGNEGEAAANPAAPAKPLEPERDAELGPATIPAKPKREVTAESIRSARQATAGELLGHLVETGTNRQKLADAYRWYEAHHEATAEQCFRYLETAEDHGHAPTSPGTIRKAGQWLWGAAWEPLTARVSTPSEEAKMLRERIDAQEQQIFAKSSEMLSMRNQIAFLEDQVRRLGSENDYLKSGRRADAGLGRNALEMELATV